MRCWLCMKCGRQRGFTFDCEHSTPTGLPTGTGSQAGVNSRVCFLATVTNIIRRSGGDECSLSKRDVISLRAMPEWDLSLIPRRYLEGWRFEPDGVSNYDRIKDDWTDASGVEFRARFADTEPDYWCTDRYNNAKMTTWDRWTFEAHGGPMLMLAFAWLRRES